METFYLILILFLGHWFGDFVIQSEDLAYKKHKRFVGLLKHSTYYSLVFLVIGIVLNVFNLFGVSILGTLVYTLLTFGLHLLVDFGISRLGYNSLWKRKYNEFLGVLLIDHIIHCLLLWYTFILIF